MSSLTSQERRTVPSIAIDRRRTEKRENAYRVEGYTGNGYLVTVSFVDPTENLGILNETDIAAYNQGISYYPENGEAIPLFPPELTKGFILADALPGVSITTCLDHDLNTVSSAIERTLVPLERTMCPQHVGRVLYDDLDPVSPMLRMARHLAYRLRDKRRSSIAPEVSDILYNKWRTLSDGTFRTEDHPTSSVIVEELTLLTFSTLGQYGRKHDIPLLHQNMVYRFNGPEHAANTASLIKALARPNPKVDDVKGLFFRLVRPTFVSESAHEANILGYPALAPCTAPIRQYAALANVRQIVAHLDNQPLPYTRKNLKEIAEWLNRTNRRTGMGIIRGREASRAIPPVQGMFAKLNWKCPTAALSEVCRLLGTELPCPDFDKSSPAAKVTASCTLTLPHGVFVAQGKDRKREAAVAAMHLNLLSQLRNAEII